MENEATRLAVVGAGYWGPKIIRNLVAIDADCLAWVCDIDQAALDGVKRDHPGIRTTLDFSEILKDPETDAVMLALPPDLHHDFALRALEAGKHLFVEKPMALTTREVREIVRYAGDAGLLLMVGLTYRYNVMIQRIGRVIREGHLGSIRSVFSRRTNLNHRPKHTSVIWSLAPHDVSILQNWFGSGPVELRARAERKRHPKFVDAAQIQLDFENGVSAHLDLSWVEPGKTRRIAVVGSEKTLVYDEISAPFSLYLYENGEGGAGDSWDAVEALVRYGSPVEEIDEPPNLPEPLSNECRHFLECLASGKTPLTDGRCAIEVTRVIQAILAAVSEGVGDAAREGDRP